MSYPIFDFIRQAFRNQYQNEVLADHRGNLFTVRHIEVGADEDGLTVSFYDRSIHGTNDAWLARYGGLPYDVKERRSLSLGGHETLPTIISLAWDKKDTKTWVAIPPRHERDNKPHPLNLP